MVNDQFVDACLRGVRSAFKKHARLTGGLSLGRAPEGFIQGEIACALGRVAKYVTLEASVKEILRLSNAEARGKRPRMGRIDIAAWCENRKPRFVLSGRFRHCIR